MTGTVTYTSKNDSDICSCRSGDNGLLKQATLRHSYPPWKASKLVDNIGQSNFRYDITEKKLFILIPKNCFTYNEIKNADVRIKSAGNLEPYETHRGGISKRRYQHTVHQIKMPRPDKAVDKYYVVLEYATPLMSLFDMSEHAQCGLSRQERDEQVVLFYHKLREILEGCKECKGRYELVLISGEVEDEIADVLVPMLQ